MSYLTEIRLHDHVYAQHVPRLAIAWHRKNWQQQQQIAKNILHINLCIKSSILGESSQKFTSAWEGELMSPNVTELLGSCDRYMEVASDGLSISVMRRFKRFNHSNVQQVTWLLKGIDRRLWQLFVRCHFDTAVISQPNASVYLEDVEKLP